MYSQDLQMNSVTVRNLIEAAEIAIGEHEGTPMPTKEWKEAVHQAKQTVDRHYRKNAEIQERIKTDEEKRLKGYKYVVTTGLANLQSNDHYFVTMEEVIEFMANKQINFRIRELKEKTPTSQTINTTSIYDVKCEKHNCFMKSTPAETRAEFEIRIQNEGWIIKENICYCPKCEIL